MIVGGVLLALESLSGASRIETLGVTALDGKFIAALVLSITFFPVVGIPAARVLVGTAVSIAGLLLWLIVQSSGALVSVVSGEFISAVVLEEKKGRRASASGID